MAGHIILCGLDGLGFRTLEELELLGEKVTVIAHSSTDPLVVGAKERGATFIEGNYQEEAILRLAGIERASAIVITHDGDISNLHAALAAQEINPHVRIVLRMFNQELGDRVAALFTDCIALSSSALAAPAFVSAALHEDWEQQLVVAGRNLVIRRGNTTDTSVLLPLLKTTPGEKSALFPSQGDNLLCLAQSNLRLQKKPRQVFLRPPHPLEMATSVRRMFRNTDWRLRTLLSFLFFLILVSTLVFHFFYNLSLIDALYFTVTIITTTGFGDINLSNGTPWIKLFGVSLMLFGASTLALFYAFITDAIVRARLEGILNRSASRMSDHIIVCGLGSIGYRVVEQLAQLNIPVVAVELQESARFLSTVRRLGVPVIVGDARLPDTLRALNVARARCVVVATDNDLANIETALNARAVNPQIRVVLRLFDPDLSARVERAFKIHISRSVAALAAPAFAAAAIGRRVLTTIPVSQSIFLIAEVNVEAGSPAEGKTLLQLEQTVEGRVLLLRNTEKENIWVPPFDTVLLGGTELVLVVTRSGLTRVLTYTDKSTP